MINEDNGITMGTLDRTINKTSNPAKFQENDNEVSCQEAQNVLQEVTQNSTSLGKVLEFLERDLTEMQKEYEKWEVIEKNALKELSKEVMQQTKRSRISRGNF